MINQKQQKLLNILANAVHGIPSEAISQEEWAEYMEVYSAQTVWALPAQISDSIFADDVQKNHYMDQVTINVLDFYKIMEDQKKIVELLESSGISAAVLKGAASAANYPHPEYRCMGDIDMIVKPADFERAYELLCSNGYQNKNTLENYQRHINFITPYEESLELHSRFSSGENEKQNEIFDRYIYNGIDDCRSVRIGRYQVPVLGTLANGLVLLGHINQHLPSGLGLRQIMDWMFYVEKSLDDVLWNTEFEYAAEQIGMKKLAIVTTAMCRKHLGLQGDITWCDELATEDLSLIDELMEYVLSKGNFGRVNEADSFSVVGIRAFRHPIKSILIAQERGLMYWERARKVRWLRPFAWLYLIGHWISRGRSKNAGLTEFAYAVKKEKKESDMLERLGVTRS